MSRNYLKRVVEVADLDDPRIGAYRNRKDASGRVHLYCRRKSCG